MKLSHLPTLLPLLTTLTSALRTTSTPNCTRSCMTTIVNQILDSILTHDPSTLPLAQQYRATENSHPAALSMMTLWRTVTHAPPPPNLLAIDTTTGSAYFALDITEGSTPTPSNPTSQTQSVLWTRIKVQNQQITELEIYINRSRGDHGFSFSPAELPHNYHRWMSPPSSRTKATRRDLESLSAATSNPNYNLTVTVASTCQLTEEGWRVVDPGPDGNGFYVPLWCSWPDIRPTDLNARLNLVIDEELGIVVTGAVGEGKEEWLRGKLEGGGGGLVRTGNATGETLQVLQLYDGVLQGQQVMLYLSGPGMRSVWRD
ncbi:uncharacterized protein BO80DRAFT_453799 [Aspergillus ibericus CBS 121593]|uniref:AttH domain-containing protein n=1 Tax=Aspergillus ibericus CBS 121593 TaxID=1448316 RepID=A0A395H3T7_9EURO|nr:hypothetical protein BO80DRAFT_453799 [Aspergillus ibericus CBS 121593]RAL02567.1 hypothetical protein BO80DRAFT_453799 [Aspergillus ibericus CBS 121593]